jgi:hypothetical protein
MDKKNLKQQLDFELAVTLGYSHRKRSKRIVINIKQQLYDSLVKKYHLNGRFQINKNLEEDLLLMISHTYPDDLKVEIENQFRVVGPKFIELEGPHTSFPQLVVKCFRTESK